MSSGDATPRGAVTPRWTVGSVSSTRGADLQLLTTVRAHRGAGDATAQAICDAACRWRDHTRLDGPDEPGSFRWLLAQTVDRYRRPRWKKHRLRVGLALGLIGGGSLIADGVMDFAGVDSPLAHQVALAVALDRRGRCGHGSRQAAEMTGVKWNVSGLV